MSGISVNVIDYSILHSEASILGLNLEEGGPGEMGHPVHIPEEKQEAQKELFKLNQFNLMASDMISLNRSLPDYRSPE